MVGTRAECRQRARLLRPRGRRPHRPLRRQWHTTGPTVLNLCVQCIWKTLCPLCGCRSALDTLFHCVPALHIVVYVVAQAHQHTSIAQDLCGVSGQLAIEFASSCLQKFHRFSGDIQNFIACMNSIALVATYLAVHLTNDYFSSSSPGNFHRSFHLGIPRLSLATNP